MKPDNSHIMSIENNLIRDKFGNKIEVTELNDNCFKKVTQTNNHSDFEFMGETYSCNLLLSAETVKVYWDEYHSIRELVKDKYGRLFHYRYDEEMRFDGGPDREDFLWTLVESESQSDRLSEESGMSLLVEPFIAGDETGWMSAHEYVDKAYVKNLRAKSGFLQRLKDLFSAF
ncbi:hypothetical protein [Paludibacter sp.]|uniref:hypothetical protein n=1 Tax=Paludibacter sp. TaxID=1898105 RepID=UPI001353EFA2|nr:hypothetical protein [Paludibacter sp.]MTK53102.1 hypothetical protein [Paludibacter sp.]